MTFSWSQSACEFLESSRGVINVHKLVSRKGRMRQIKGNKEKEKKKKTANLRVPTSGNRGSSMCFPFYEATDKSLTPAKIRALNQRWISVAKINTRPVSDSDIFPAARPSIYIHSIFINPCNSTGITARGEVLIIFIVALFRVHM